MRKKVLLLATLVLALVFPVLAQQVSAEEDAYYVYPTIEFDAVQLNATAYRFHSGDTLNFTFTFTTQGGVLSSYPEHYTEYIRSKKSGNLNITCYLDGIRTSTSYYGLGVEGSGRTWNAHIHTVRTVGNHTINYNWLFTIDEDAEGYWDINFLSEVKLKIEKLPAEPIPTDTLLLAGGAIGASMASVTIGALFFINKRRNKPSKEEPL